MAKFRQRRRELLMTARSASQDIEADAVDDWHPDDVGCRLCGRTDRPLTRHHLVPRCCHRNKWFRKRMDASQMQATVEVCRGCHDMIHRFVPDEKSLGRNYSTLASLRRHPEIANYLRWARVRVERSQT